MPRVERRPLAWLVGSEVRERRLAAALRDRGWLISPGGHTQLTIARAPRPQKIGRLWRPESWGETPERAHAEKPRMPTLGMFSIKHRRCIVAFISAPQLYIRTLILGPVALGASARSNPSTANALIFTRPQGRAPRPAVQVCERGRGVCSSVDRQRPNERTGPPDLQPATDKVRGRQNV